VTTEPVAAARAKQIVLLLREELSRHLGDVDATIASFGQVEAAGRRERGELFSLRDHLRGMVLSMLSANRPWKPIADSLAALAEVFGDYKPSFLEQASAESLEAAVKRINCGNRRVSFQMKAIRPNLETFRRIDAEAGSIDQFIDDRRIEDVVHELGEGRRYKLKELGPTLVFEYLKNVGVRASKPDVHVLRICGPNRLAVLPGGASPLEAFQAFRAFAQAAGVDEVALDNMIWLLGADEYAAVCGANPKCHRCALRVVCRQDRAV
jgi:endonuclease III